ncbi:MAG: pentapeptide repeat-containing protein [Deltaproteobacteria bacterium]|nr:pentapeptide repeat-containing protein [Deltaproteobacteria bacterium]
MAKASALEVSQDDAGTEMNGEATQNESTLLSLQPGDLSSQPRPEASLDSPGKSFGERNPRNSCFIWNVRHLKCLNHGPRDGDSDELEDKVDVEFEELAQLLAKSRTYNLDTAATRTNATWSLYKGSYKVHSRSFPFEVLYINSRATKESLGRALAQIKPGATQVVYASSLEKRIRGLSHILAPYGDNAATPRDYLASFLKDELETYRQKLLAATPEFYIEPNIETPSLVNKKIPNPLVSLLKGDLTSTELESGVLGVLLAEAGQGKTFMTEYLAANLANSSIIPIYIRSAQWSSMSVDDLRSPEKTITNAFRFYGSPIGWAEGCEEEFLRVTLRAGLFCIIFDGFDEYVLRNQGKVQAVEVLSALKDLARSAGARILMTSRTAFWATDVSNSDNDDNSSLGVLTYKILPFDQSKGRLYFTKRFGETKKKAIESASNLYGLLLKKNSDLAGRGFVLNLVADLIDRSGSSSVTPDLATNVAWWLLEQICERERLRQQLPITSAQQLEALQVFVAEESKGLPASQENLEMALSAAADLRDDERRTCVSKLRSHPLIDVSGEKWEVRQEQVRYLLLARYLERLAFSSDGRGELTQFVRGTRLEPASSEQVADALLELVSDGRDAERALTDVKGIVSTILEASADVGEGHNGRRLGMAIALAATDRFRGKTETAASRTRLLLELIRSQSFVSLPIFGTLNRFDFNGVVFDRCKLDRVTFVSCTFDGATIFKECRFDGVRAIRSAAFGMCNFQACSMDSESSDSVRNEQISSGKRAYSRDDLKADMASVVDKFVSRGGRGLKSVTEARLRDGGIGGSRHKDAILQELMHGVLELHEISGITEKGIHIDPRATKSLQFFAENNVFTGALADAFERIAKKIKI